jgi:TonB-linked SusC/RagA family outer membrane protein
MKTIYKLKKGESTMKKTILLFVCLLLSGSALWAQAGRVSGVVTENGRPLPGASVAVKGTASAVIADANGLYAINVPENAVLVFRFIGFKTQEIAIGSRTVLDVELEAESTQLDEVVVVGYGTQRRKELTGSVVTLPRENLAQVSTSFETLLGGAVPGLNVIQSSGQPGAAYNIRIRGGNSVIGGNEPLYVIDGIIIYEDDASSSTSAGVSRISSRLNPLAALSPGDIESVEVLKDVSATAIYGSRGSNGVIIVTTKSGKKGRNNIEYQYTIGWQKASKQLSLLDASDWARLNKEIYAPITTDKVYSRYKDYTEQQFDALGKGTDWQDAALCTAATQNHQLTVSGGDEKTRYLISGNFTDQGGIIVNTDFKRYTGRFNFERDLFRNLSVGITANAGKVVQNGLSDYSGLETGSAQNSLGYVILIPNVVPIYNADGSYNYNNVHEVGDLRYGDRTVNAISDLYNNVSQNTANTLSGNFYVNYNILAELKLRVVASVNRNNATQNFFAPSTSAAGFLAKGYGSIGNKLTDSRQYEYTLNYDKQLNEHHYLNVLAGYTTQETVIERTTATTTAFSNETLNYHNLQAGEVPLQPVTSGSISTLYSYLGRVNYTLNGKYNLTATIRADGSSRFADGHKWGIFPSLGLSWNVNEESFLKNTKSVNNLKLRTSLGTVGNQEIGDYRYLDTWLTTKYAFDNNVVIGYIQGNRANPDLKWETTSQYNIGIDLGLFSRLTITADAYYKKTSDLLLNVPVEITTGYSSQLKNVGSLTNKGVEFDVSGVLIDNKDFTWNLSANIAKNINRVTKADRTIYGTTLLQEGEEYGSFYGLVFDGIVQNRDDISKVPVPARNGPDNPILPGDIKYKDQNNDKKIDLEHDRVVLGSPQPEFTYGFSTSLRYKDLTLFAAFQGSQGNEIYNALRRTLEVPDGSYNMSTALLDRWTETNPSNTVPRAVISTSATDLDSRYIEDASFLKLRVLSLSYQLPVKIPKAPTVKFRLLLTAQNLFTLTKYTGYDPEIASGVDSGVYPTARTFTLGFHISY